ncbi:hypothetical protein LSM04_001012 [Trypanosoma melophagium]|uniref:uncharacterized protein n=1 Tax=Trypanosoma melophagium TaxID=715481 RepID=UPI00351A9C33|nr:hypothetical protein LSM04_001012 [Trypanosoma melophagium]
MQPSHEMCTLAAHGGSSSSHNDKNNTNDNNSNISFASKVAGWLVPDVRRHLFLLVWVCGIPVHIRYVVHLLRISAVSLDMRTMEKTDLQQYQREEIRDEEKEVSVPCERALRTAALDILFTMVASDCYAANEKVREMSLSQTEWSDVRSLMYSRVGNNNNNNNNNSDMNSSITRIVSQPATVKGEVLALVPSGDVPLAELQLVYFTALDRARHFEQQCSYFYSTPTNHREETKKNYLCLGKKQQQQQQQKKKESRHKTLSEVSTGSDVIVVDSDEGVSSLRDEVVVLSDDSNSNSHNNKNNNKKSVFCKPAKRQRTSSEDIYELVE